MKLSPVGSNQTVLELDNGTNVLFSYKTPVAAFISGRGFLKTKTKYSKTTSKHINVWLRKQGDGTAEEVEQTELDALV